MKKFKACEIELFTDFSYFLFEKKIFDLHNDFLFQSLKLTSRKLTFLFKSRIKENVIRIHFYNVEITEINFENINELSEMSIIDIFYRGRFERDQGLCEYDVLGRGYFYLDFIADVKIEFFADSFALED